MKKNLNLYLLKAYNASATFTFEKFFLTISFFSLLFVLLTTAASAQSLPVKSTDQDELISGIVKDDAQQALADVNVMVKGTNAGVNTDEKGRFSIAVDLSKYNTLVFTYISKKTTELLLEKGKRVDITMYDDPSFFTDLVITGEAGADQLYTEKKSNKKHSRVKAERE